MGLPDEYKLPRTYNESYHLTGDGVAVPVVRWLAQHLFEPVLQASGGQHGEESHSSGGRHEEAAA
jgi:DNA (cytosine-5)-methyltransferase 1